MWSSKSFFTPIQAISVIRYVRSSGVVRLYSSSERSRRNFDFKLLWGKFASTIKTFASGTKALYSDVKEMYRIQSTVRKYSITGTAPIKNEHGDLDFPLSWKQLTFVYSTKKNLIKMLPTVTLFCIPVLGYVVPFIAFMYPEKLLSHYFWSDHQKMAIQLLMSRESGIAFQKLLGDIRASDDEFVQQLAVLLSKTKSSILSPSYDLKGPAGSSLDLLSDAWDISSWLPSSFRQRRLEKHMQYLFTCDWLLWLENEVDNLKHEEVLVACLERKIGTPKDETDHLREQLNRWISVTTLYKECPVGLMSHLPLAQHIS